MSRNFTIPEESICYEHTCPLCDCGSVTVDVRGDVPVGARRGAEKGEPRAAMHYAHRRFDARHFDHRLWALGRAYPHGVSVGALRLLVVGRWLLDFYDHPLNGPPELVSEIAYDEQGNLVPVEAGMSVPPGPPSMPPPPPGAMGPPPSPPPAAMGPSPPPPPPPGPNPVAGAIVGGAVGGIVGGALGRGPGALAGAAMVPRPVRSLLRKPSRGLADIIGGAAPYYRYPNGAWSPPMGPNYCGY